MDRAKRRSSSKRQQEHISGYVDESIVRHLDRVAAMKHRSNRSTALEWALGDAISHNTRQQATATGK